VVKKTAYTLKERPRLFKELPGKQLLFFDGAMGSQLQKYGLKTGEMPDLWNITHPDTVREIHTEYLEAGCDILKTNTFGCNSIRLSDTPYTTKQIIEIAVKNAKSAIREFNTQKPHFTALDIGPIGKLLKPLGDLSFEEAYELFRELVVEGAAAGADLILIETMSDAYELKAAVLAAKENCALPVIASVTLDENGKLLTGGGVDVVVSLLEGLGVDVIGFNCGYGEDQLMPFVTKALETSSTPVLFMPNAGLPDYANAANGIARYSTTPEVFAKTMRQNAENGVWLLGGCCGTTPEHIEALVKSCAGVVPPAIKKKNLTVASSYSKTVSFGGKTVIIGERINPTGKPKLKQALKDGDYDYVLREGILQTEQGAEALDVNAGVPGIDEKDVLLHLVLQLQSVTDIPLQIDSADTDALVSAMRLYNGKPIINSINGKKSVMDAVFPHVKKYGAVVVALTLDENGIPQTAQGRVDIAKKIIEYAKNYGIAKETFLFDPLTMAVSAGQDNALITLESVRRLKQELGVKTILGVSNVSFGLPCRDVLNGAFLSLAVEAGLDAAIFNPAVKISADMPETSRQTAIDALLGKDSRFEKYIAFYGEQKQSAAPVPTETKDISLGEAVLKGLEAQAKESAKRSLSLPPLEVIEKELIPALNTAGVQFEQGKIYLPQLLMCAQAAKSAFEIIRGNITEDTHTKAQRHKEEAGVIILATVEGDVHDIGKNILRTMLESYRFHVIDLGKDVPVNTVVEAAQKHNARIVGLSALMTTTVVNMEKTIRALHEEVPECKIMCGGAVLTKEYAQRIGADYYGKDAMAGVRYAQQIFGS
jgi:5-methyltetrahydrofolate--homocysteine methyltransferase